MKKIEILENGNVKMTIPISFCKNGCRRRIVSSETDLSNENSCTILALNLARAFRWQALIDNGTYANIVELAQAIGKDKGFVARIIRLTFLAPEIIHAVLNNSLPEGINADDLRKINTDIWSHQKEIIGL